MPNDQAVSDSIAASALAALSTVEPRPGVPKPDPIMVADHVRRSFGGLTAVNVEHVEIQRGAITALIGPNGAGKTTFFNLITGFDDADEGTWTFNDRQVAGTAPYKLARIGMVRTFQLTKALSRMTVIDNMRLGAKHQTGERFFAAILPFLWNSQEKSVGPSLEAEPPRPHQDHARRGHHRALRRARHGHGSRHQRLGHRHGPG